MTLCDLLGEHGTLLPLVTPALDHVGYYCAGCGAVAGLDGVLGAPNGDQTHVLAMAIQRMQA